MALFSTQTNDEYVDGQKKKFKLEAFYLILLVASINVLQGVIRGEITDHVIVCGMLLFIAALYYILRTAWTGIDHPNIATNKAYQKKKRILRKSMVSLFLIYAVLNVGDKLLFDKSRTWTDIIAVSIIFIIIFFAIEMISLRKSYKKNQEMVDDLEKND